MDRYEVLNPLGNGVFGNVSLVKSKVDQKLYALKTPSSDKNADVCLSREEMVSRHIPREEWWNFICPIEFIKNEQGKIEGAISEYLPGETLNKVDLTLSELDHILTEMLTTLVVLQKYKVAHRDIKPHNIIWTPEERKVHLIDFGNASIVNSNNLRGSPKYWSREIVLLARSKEKPVYSLEMLMRGDIYALGVTIYFLLHKTMPYRKLLDDKAYDYKTYVRSEFKSEVITEQGHSDKDFNQIIDMMIIVPQPAKDILDWWKKRS